MLCSVLGKVRWLKSVLGKGKVAEVLCSVLGKVRWLKLFLLYCIRRPLGRPRRRWVDNIRMVLQEVECGHVDWIGLAQDRDRWRTLVSAVMNLRVP